MPKPTVRTVKQHTVAVYLPGTANRVLVDTLEGSEAEAGALAMQIVAQLAKAGPQAWAHKVTSTALVTELDDSTDSEMERSE